MADTTPAVDPVTPAAPSNEPSTPAVPPVVTSTETGEVERLRKEKEQAEMRANQLANQLKAKEDADAATEAKKLEEQNQYKELYEQEKAKREGYETDAEAKERQTAVAETKTKVLSEYSEEVKAIAEEAGMDLADTDDAAVDAFKEKLEKISKRVTNGKPGPNNPNPVNNKEELSGDALRLKLQDENSFHDLITDRFPGIKAMTKPKS